MRLRLKGPQEMKLFSREVLSVPQGVDGAGWSVWELNQSGEISALNETGGVACGMSLLSVP